MPELPEVETVCQTLAPFVTERCILGVEVFWPRTVEPLNPDRFAKALIGKRIQRVFRRAKFIVFELSDHSIVATHLRMTGRLVYVDLVPRQAESEAAQHLRALFHLDDNAALHFYDARKFGRIRYFEASEWEAFERGLGLEPLSPEFTKHWLSTLLKGTRRQIKPLLLDQQKIAGIGNIYADEILYLARIHPEQRASSISSARLNALHDAIVETLQSAIRQQGTTLRDYRDGQGQPGTNQVALQVYGAPAGARCPRCGAGFRKITVGQRGTTFCPRCQRKR